MGLPEMWEAGRTGKFFSPNTHFSTTLWQRSFSALQGRGLAQARPRWCPVESAWEAQSWAVLPLCSGHRARLVLPLLSRGLAPSFLPVWLLGGSQSHHWAGWSRCPSRQWARTSPVTSHGPSQSRSKMSTRSIQPITVAWMVLGAACPVNHAPWGRKSMEKDFVKSPAQSSITSFFKKCVTLPEKLLVFSSQTRLIFL